MSAWHPHVVSFGSMLLQRLLQLLHLTLLLHQTLVDQPEHRTTKQWADTEKSHLTPLWSVVADLFSVSSSLFLRLASSRRLCNSAIFSLSEPSWASFSILFSCCRRIRCSLDTNHSLNCCWHLTQIHLKKSSLPHFLLLPNFSSEQSNQMTTFTFYNVFHISFQIVSREFTDGKQVKTSDLNMWSDHNIN